MCFGSLKQPFFSLVLERAVTLSWSRRQSHLIEAVMAIEMPLRAACV